MANGHDERQDESLPAPKAQWEPPTVTRAGHLGDVLQDKGLISEDDPGDTHYKTPGHDMTP